MQLYRVIESNEALTPVTIWLHLGNAVQSRGGHALKATYRMPPFPRNVQSRQVRRERSGWGGMRGRKNWEVRGFFGGEVGMFRNYTAVVVTHGEHSIRKSLHCTL